MIPLTAATRGWTLLLWTLLRPRDNDRHALLSKYLPLRHVDLMCRRIPVVDHLRCEHKVEREARNEAVQDERIVDLLEGGEDARERACEVVEDLS